MVSVKIVASENSGLVSNFGKPLETVTGEQKSLCQALYVCVVKLVHKSINMGKKIG